ncbi:MAG: hemerythrin domain-containing protein [Deltaproteobacteria bacterium]|nr:hemerythrin domain-containing protein [Deltaproteobacteria bacterium]MBW2393135.1 hemerythrin domain-containing protein [Deltaproteobacteria bacterium]
MHDSIVAAHRSLDGLFEITRRSLEEGLGAPAIDAFCRLREALEAHFEQEDRLYYPPIAALRPEARRSVQEFAASHEVFRERFGEIGGLLERSCFDEAGRAFAEFTEIFVLHEAAEEKLLAELDRDVSAAR